MYIGKGWYSLAYTEDKTMATIKHPNQDGRIFVYVNQDKAKGYFVQVLRFDYLKDCYIQLEREQHNYEDWFYQDIQDAIYMAKLWAIVRGIPYRD
jgi:hypothetical protein